MSVVRFTRRRSGDNGGEWVRRQRFRSRRRKSRESGDGETYGLQSRAAGGLSINWRSTILRQVLTLSQTTLNAGAGAAMLSRDAGSGYRPDSKVRAEWRKIARRRLFRRRN
ncbi:MAG: hypothetical protein U0Y68_24290 [Blastocatellia bacterium]